MQRQKSNHMEQNKIDMFIAQNASKFPQNKMGLIKDALTKLDDDKSLAIQSLDLKDPSTVLIVSILCGGLGVDRFMLGEVGLGLVKLFTCGGCYIWLIIDMINAKDRTQEYNYKQLSNALMMQGVTGLY